MHGSRRPSSIDRTARADRPVRGPITSGGGCAKGRSRPTIGRGFAFIGDRPVTRAGDRPAGRFDPPETARWSTPPVPDQGSSLTPPARRRSRRARFARPNRPALDINRVRIVAARPPMARGSTTTIPLLPWPFPCVVPGVQGRPGGGRTLWCPGGPLASPGQGGRGFGALPVTGSAAVGVGRGVGWAVGRAVETAGDGDGRVDPGVGVGMTATAGGSVGMTADAEGSADGATDGSTEGTTADGVGSGLAPVEPVGVGSLAGGDVGACDGAGVPRLPAMSPFGRAGATRPAVNATVARMRFRSPMATTSRAR